jgi:hypothetical protein
MSTQQEIPSKVITRLEEVRELEGLHFKMLDKAFGGRKAIYSPDMILVAVMNRSIFLIDGFVTMVEHRNFVCAMPLARLQIDNILRLHATSLVEDSQSLLSHLFKQTPLHKMKSRDGKPLTDKYLCEQVSLRYTWITKAYQRLSSFVHLSQPHLTSSIEVSDPETRMAYFAVGKASRTWKEEEMLETIEYFEQATKTILEICSEWSIEDKQANVVAVITWRAGTGATNDAGK